MMGCKDRKGIFREYDMLVLILILLSYLLLSAEIVNGRKISTSNHMELPMTKGTIISIKTGFGVIDCVDMYKQPAFDHPLLKNHKIQIKPSSEPTGYPREENDNKNSQLADLFRDWPKNGESCPKGTIPIMRTKIHDNKRNIGSLIPNWRSNNKSTLFAADNSGHGEHAAVATNVDENGEELYGAQAYINIWRPSAFDNEETFSQIWLVARDDNEFNTIEAGYYVSADDGSTRFFVYWTRDSYKETGCFNLECPGFVQTSPLFIFDHALNTVSSYNGNQYELKFAIFKGPISGNWWLKIKDIQIGYWPGNIFTSLAKSAMAINWGGLVFYTKTHGRHTSTQMGSGHFPTEGFGKASYFRDIGYFDSYSDFKPPKKFHTTVTNPPCYDVLANVSATIWGTYFYFGGPGYSDICQN